MLGAVLNILNSFLILIMFIIGLPFVISGFLFINSKEAFNAGIVLDEKWTETIKRSYLIAILAKIFRKLT